MDTIVCCIVKKRKIVGFYVVPRNNGYIHTVDEYGHDRHSHTIPKYPYIFIIQFNSWQEIKIQTCARWVRVKKMHCIMDGSNRQKKIEIISENGVVERKHVSVERARENTDWN